jgi:hypothetical protein
MGDGLRGGSTTGGTTTGSTTTGGTTTGGTTTTGAPSPPSGPTGSGTATASTGGTGTDAATPATTATGSSVGQPIREPYVHGETEAAEGACPNTTCVTTKTVAIANHRNVKSDKVKAKMDFVMAGECKPPTGTGVRVARQMDGEIEYYGDRFCLNSGCSFVGEACQ